MELDIATGARLPDPPFDTTGDGKLGADDQISLPGGTKLSPSSIGLGIGAASRPTPILLTPQDITSKLTQLGVTNAQLSDACAAVGGTLSGSVCTSGAAQVKVFSGTTGQLATLLNSVPAPSAALSRRALRRTSWREVIGQ